MFSLTASRQRAGPLLGQSLSRFSFATSGFEKQIHDEMHARKVAPSTWYYFLNYRVLPSQVKATGPRGYLTKSDVILHIEANKLQKQAVESDFQAPKETSPATPAQPEKPKAKKQASKQAGKQAQASPVRDPNNPFVHTWEDSHEVNVAAAESLHHAKRYLAHSYMSVRFDASLIEQTFPEVPLEHFLRKAVKNAYRQISDADISINGEGNGDLIKLVQVDASTESF